MGSAAPSPILLSKSRFISGTQCLKQLWWRVHDPNAPELVPDRALQSRFDQGMAVGRAARDHVAGGGGELIDIPFYQLESKVAATRRALGRAEPAPVLYEG